MAKELHEYFGNIHMHTVYSDGTGTFKDLVAGAAEAGVDFVIVTDHNIFVRDKEEGYRQGILTLVGQEVHDPYLEPPGNHLLCLGVCEDVTDQAASPQTLIDAVKAQGGLPFLAHPIEHSTPLIPEAYNWQNWEVTGYTGIELWNYMSTFRPHVTSKKRAVALGYFPHYFTNGPLPEMLAKWDELLAERQVVAIGGTDVHAQQIKIGIFSRCFLPYNHCARALNTHILTQDRMLGPKGSEATGHEAMDRHDEHVQHDRQIVLQALAAGHCWIGYDLAGSTRGFRFSAQNHHGEAIMGDCLPPPTSGKTTFNITLPQQATIRLIHDGRVIHEAKARDLHYESAEAGVYRVEVWKRRWGKLRGWIFSNPIYVRGGM
jgi:hypothetical protein